MAAQLLILSYSKLASLVTSYTDKTIDAAFSWVRASPTFLFLILSPFFFKKFFLTSRYVQPLYGVLSLHPRHGPDLLLDAVPSPVILWPVLADHAFSTHPSHLTRSDPGLNRIGTYIHRTEVCFGSPMRRTLLVMHQVMNFSQPHSSITSSSLLDGLGPGMPSPLAKGHELVYAD